MFKKTTIITEGQCEVKILGAELLEFAISDAVKLDVRADNGARNSFLIFTNNAVLIDRLLEATLGLTADEDIDEQLLVGYRIVITTKKNEKNYLNIIDVSLAEESSLHECKEDLEDFDI